jgi:hypothetical protein
MIRKIAALETSFLFDVMSSFLLSAIYDSQQMHSMSPRIYPGQFLTHLVQEDEGNTCKLQNIPEITLLLKEETKH